MVLFYSFKRAMNQDISAWAPTTGLANRFSPEVKKPATGTEGM
jgi:hypothetical protein